VAEVDEGSRKSGSKVANRRPALIVVTLLVLALAGFGGYLLGKAGGEDTAAATAAGARIGHDRGVKRGTQAGYQAGFRVGRARGYRQAFAPAFRSAYIKAFAEAELSLPKAETIDLPSKR